MARFRGVVTGDRGNASRLGHRSLTVDANAWDIGVHVESVSHPISLDGFDVYATGGSNGGRHTLLGRLAETDAGIVWTPNADAAGAVSLLGWGART